MHNNKAIKQNNNNKTKEIFMKKYYLKFIIIFVISFQMISCAKENDAGSLASREISATETDRTSDRSTSLGQCSAPNRLSTVQEVARDHPNLLRNSNNCSDSGNYDFLEKVLVELRKTDSKWGYYHRTQHNLNYASYDAIAYYCGSGNGNRSSDLRFIDIISSRCQVYWGHTGHEGRANPAKGYWKYPRTNSNTNSDTSSNTNSDSDTASSAVSTCNSRSTRRPPNLQREVQKLATAHPAAYRAVWDGSRYTNDHRFLDLVVARFREIDDRFGYNCVRGNCNRISADAVAYFRGEGSPNNSADVQIIDFLRGAGANTPLPAWTDVTNETCERNAIGRWKYPRTGSSRGNSNKEHAFSDFNFSKVTWLHQNVSGWAETSRITSVQVKSGGQICINDTERGRWPTGNPLGSGQLDGNPWVFVKIKGRYYGATYEWLRPGQICKFGHENTKPLSKVYSSAWRGHINKHPLNRWVPKAGEVVGFMISGLARHRVRNNVRKRSNVQFYRLPKTNGTGGAMLGSYSSKGGGTGSTGDTGGSTVIGQCGPTPNTCAKGDFHNHPEDTADKYLWTCRNKPRSTGEKRCEAPKTNTKNACTAEQLKENFKTVDNACLPPCAYFLPKNNLPGLETAKDAECQDTQNYNIQQITSKVHDAQTCCRRSSKKICPQPHYSLRTYQNVTNCYPSCGMAAYFAGWGSYGADQKEGTVDDPHIFSGKHTSCEELDLHGHTDWKDFIFYDVYRFTKVTNRGIEEIIPPKLGVCCVRGEKTNVPASPGPGIGSTPDSDDDDTEDECQTDLDCTDSAMMQCLGGECIEIIP